MIRPSAQVRKTAAIRREKPDTGKRYAIFGSLALLAGLAFWQSNTSNAAELAVVIPPPVVDLQAAPDAKTETAVFAGGCFWGVQGVFQHVKGVTNAVSGYAGGDQKTAEYDKVGSGRTGHAEAVKITYDPKQVTYGQLMQIYFSVAHNPTELNRQGPDTGTQYRSTIFPVNADQMRVAKEYVAQLDKAKVYGKPVVTTIEPMKPFFPAEAYHQDFLAKNPRHPYIAFNDIPKVENLKKTFPSMYREQPVLVSAAGAGA